MAAERQIVAMGGGGFMMDDPVLDRFVLDLVDAPRPKICLLPTAVAAMPVVVTRFFEAFPSKSFEPTFLDLFDRTVEDLASFVGEQDVVYVGGGNTANMLAIWRVHGMDTVLRAAWEAGVVMAGLSAGANCWFEASTTDSWPGASAPTTTASPSGGRPSIGSSQKARFLPGSRAMTSLRSRWWARMCGRWWAPGPAREPIA
jgi:peptidase E